MNFSTAVKTFSGCGAAGKDRAGDPVAQREKQIVAERADKAPFAGGHDHVVLLRRQTVAVQITERDNPAMGMNDTFGFAGGSGGVNDESGLVASGIG